MRQCGELGEWLRDQPLERVLLYGRDTRFVLEGLGAAPKLRMSPSGEPFLTDGGHHILDCSFGPIPNAEKLDQEMNNVVGVVEHGMFLGMTSLVIIGSADGVSTLTRA